MNVFRYLQTKPKRGNKLNWVKLNQKLFVDEANKKKEKENHN